VHLVVGGGGVLVHAFLVRQLVDAEADHRVPLVHVHVVDDVEDLVGLVDLAVLGDLDQLQRALVVPVLEAQVEGLDRVQLLDRVLQRGVVHEAPAGVGHRLEFLSPLGEMRTEAVELLDLDPVDLLVVLAVVLLDKLVLLLVLVLLLGEAVVLKLLLVDAVDDLEVVLDLLLLAQRDRLLLAGLEVLGLLDLVVLLLLLGEHLVALDEVGPD